MSSPFRSLGVFNYRLWFAGATVSNVGTWMQRTAQDWIVLTELTDHDAVAVGITTALQFGPVLLLTPLTGLAADVFDRRRLLLATQTAMAVIGAVFAALVLTGAVELWMVYGLAVALGVASAFDGPARQAFVSELVPTSLISNAVGLNATSFTVARLAGPALAGLLTAAIGAGWVLLINAVTFAATITGILAMRTAELHRQPRSPRAPGRLRAGLLYVSSRGDLAVVVLSALVFGAIGTNLPIIVATMSTVEFGLGPTEFGILSSVVAIGSVIGAIAGARRERARLSAIALSALVFGLGAIGAAVSPDAWVFGAFLVVLGFTSLVIMNTTNAYLQAATPPELRGRVMAIYIAVIIGGPTIGAPAIGFIATEAGPRWAAAAGALGGLVPALLFALWWVRAGRRASDAASASPPDQRGTAVFRILRASTGSRTGSRAGSASLGGARTPRGVQSPGPE